MARLLPPERDIGVLRAPVRSCLVLAAIFLLVILSVGLLERIGIAQGAALSAIIGAAFALFALAALLSHSRRAPDFYVADRKIAGPFGGLAGAGSFAGLIAIGLATGAYGSDAEFLVTAAGLGIGYLILGALVAPALRSYGAYTPGDFLATRFGRSWVRLAWAIIAFSVSFLLLLAHLKISGLLIATLLPVTPEHALYTAAGVTLIAVLPGGMRSLTWTQAIQYFVIALACLVPSGYLALTETEEASAIAQNFSTFSIGIPSWSSVVAVQTLMPALLAAIGAAALPLLMARTLTARSEREAGTSMIWSVLFSAMLVAAGLVLADFLSDAGALAGGIPQLAAALPSALPAVLSGLVLAGGLAALFALGQAALFSAATTLSHDIFDEILDRRGPEGRRIAAARIILIGVAVGATALVRVWQAESLGLVQWALALAAGGCFAPIVIGLRWRRCNDIGALAGLMAGFGFTALVFLMAEKVVPASMVANDWADVGAPAAAMVGVLISAVVTVGLSLATPAPEARAQNGLKGNGAARGGPPVRERPA